VDPGTGDPEEGAALQPVAHQGRRAPVVIALAGLAVIVVALVSAQSPPLVGRPALGPGSGLTSTAALAPSATGAAAPAPSPTLVPPARDPAATPHPGFAAVPAKAGRTTLTPAGTIPVEVSITLPTGWDDAGGGMSIRPDATPVPLSIGVWSIARVNTFPCRWSAGVYADRSLMQSAQGLAQALASWWGQQPGETPLTNSGIAPLASRPQQTSLAGHPAWTLDVLIPTGLDFAQCDGGQLVLWESVGADVRYALGPTEVNRLWAVETSRGPIVIDAGLSLAASGSQKAELQAIVDSIAIEP
jgi:hypothetical protein